MGTTVVQTADGSVHSVSVPTLVKNSDYLMKEFPAILERYSEVTEKDGVPWESFRDLYTGDFVKKKAKGKTGSKNETKKKEYKKEDLERIFKTLDSDDTKEIKLDAIIK